MPVVYHPSPVDGYSIATTVQRRDRKRRPRSAFPVIQTNQASADRVTTASNDEGTLSTWSSSEAAGDYVRRRPATAVASYRLLRNGSGQLLQLQHVSRRTSPFDVDEDGIPRLRFGGSYAARWTGVLDVDNCVIARRNSSKPQSDLRKVHSVADMNTRSESERDFNDLDWSARRSTYFRSTRHSSAAWRHRDVVTRNQRQVPSAEALDDFLDQYADVRRGHRPASSSSSVDPVRVRQTWTSAGDLKLLLKRSASQRSRPSSAHDIRCACALNKATPITEYCAEEDISVRYVDCRHARCFDLVDDYGEQRQAVDFDWSSATLAPDRYRPRRGEAETGNTAMSRPSSERPSTAPLIRSYSDALTPSSSPPPKKSSLLPTSYFDFVVGLKLHDWTTKLDDVASRKLRTTSADDLTTRIRHRRAASATIGQRTSLFLDPSRIDEALEDVEYVDCEELVSPDPRPHTMAAPIRPTPEETVVGLDSDKERIVERSPEVDRESSTSAAVAIDDETNRQKHIGVTLVEISRTKDRSVIVDGPAFGDPFDPDQLTEQSRDIVTRYRTGDFNDNLAEDRPARRRTELDHHPRIKTRHGTVADKSTVSFSNNKRAHEMSRDLNMVTTKERQDSHVGRIGLVETHLSLAEAPSLTRQSVAKPSDDRPSTANRKRIRNRKSTSAGRREQRKSAAKRQGDHRTSCPTDEEKPAVVDVTLDTTETPSSARAPRQKKEQKEQLRRRVGVVRPESSDDDRASATKKRVKKMSRLRSQRNLSTFLDSHGDRPPTTRRYSIGLEIRSQLNRQFHRRPSLSAEKHLRLIDKWSATRRTPSDDVNADFTLAVSELYHVDVDIFQDDGRFVGIDHRIYAGFEPSLPTFVEPPEVVPEPVEEEPAVVPKLPRPPSVDKPQSKYHKTLWASLQSEFEKLFRRGGDLKDILASVVGDNSDLQDFRDTLMKMEAFRYPEETSTDRDTKNKKSDYSQKPKLQPWQIGRLALSERACRLELPMDVRLLEKMTPQDYMHNHCKIAVRRKALYKKIFSRYQEKSCMPFKELHKALKEIFSTAIQESDVAEVCTLMQVDEETSVDLNLFSSVAAIAERLLYPKFVTDHTKDIQEYKLEKIESADFYSMLWKLDGVNVNPPMKALFDRLMEHRAVASGSH